MFRKEYLLFPEKKINFHFSLLTLTVIKQFAPTPDENFELIDKSVVLDMAVIVLQIVHCSYY